jgi:hypothetical protein
LERPKSSNTVGYAKHFSRSHDTVIRVYDAVGNLIETLERKRDFKEREAGLPAGSFLPHYRSTQREIVQDAI